MKSLKHSVRTFKEAQDTYENTKKRKLAANTYLVKTERGYGIKLYATVVVEYLDDNRIKLNTGGWNTPTTWKRIGQFTPHSINFWNLGFKRRADMPDHTIVDLRDLFLDYTESQEAIERIRRNQEAQAESAKRYQKQAEIRVRRSKFKLIVGGAK
jgi:hypothetical protein